MEKSKLNSFIKRIVSSLVLIPLVLLAIVGGYPSIFLLVLLVAGLLSWEWANMIPGKRQSFYAVCYFFAAATSIFIKEWMIIGAVILAVMALAFYKSKGEKNRGFLLLGIPYISIGIGSIVSIYGNYGYQIVLWFLFLVWGVDIGGYIFGCSIKGPKLAPKISPNKTWAGLIGGMILSATIGYAVCYYFGASAWNIAKYYVVMAIILAVIAQVGDLIESYIKRRLNLKDSSNMIPGHGGIFDRIDGLIFAAPFAYLMLKFLPYLVSLGVF